MDHGRRHGRTLSSQAVVAESMLGVYSGSAWITLSDERSKQQQNKACYLFIAPVSAS